MFVLVAGSSMLIASGISYFVPLARVAENWIGDLRMDLLSPFEPQFEPLVVVTVNEETLAQFPYRSPLDRGFLADLLAAIASRGARAIGIDLLFDQHSEKAKDERLFLILRSLRTPLVVARADAIDGLTPKQVSFQDQYLAGLSTGIPLVVSDSLDDTVRAVILRRAHDNKTQPGFAAALLAAMNVSVPDTAQLYLDYRKGPGQETLPFATYPAHAVEILPPEWLHDKIVLIGSDLDLADRHRTPLSVYGSAGSATVPGVFVHATAVRQLLEGRQAPVPGMWQSFGVLLLATALTAFVVLKSASAAPACAGVAIVTAALWATGFAVFALYRLALPLVAPTVGLGMAAGIGFIWRWRIEQDERNFVRRAFSHFVAPAIVDDIIDNRDHLRLGGERREMTFLFTDITGYTTLTESTDPERFVRIMNSYIEGTSGIVFKHGGTLDKIVGDALHVFFNAPLVQPDHAERAVKCAIDLDAYCRSFMSEQAQHGIDFGQTRIGVNTGTTIVGNVGGPNRFDYTATGDAINVAARLESVNKHLGTRICVSNATVERCAHSRFRPVGELILKGKVAQVLAFEPLLAESESQCDLDRYTATYQLMAEAAATAAAAFRDLERDYPEDRLVRFHARRLAAGESGPVILFREK